MDDVVPRAIGVTTVKTHIGRILEKLEVSNRVQIAGFVQRSETWRPICPTTVSNCPRAYDVGHHVGWEPCRRPHSG